MAGFDINPAFHSESLAGLHETKKKNNSNLQHRVRLSTYFVVGGHETTDDAKDVVEMEKMTQRKQDNTRCLNEATVVV